MLQILSNWYRKYFSDPEAMILVLAIGFAIFIGMVFGKILAPVFASIVIAYLLQWFVFYLEKFKIPHRLAVILVYVAFLSLLVISFLGLLPALWRQLISFFNDLPSMVTRGQALLMNLPERYPDFITADQLQNLMSEAKLELTRIGQIILSVSIASIPNVIMVSVYLVLVPLLVYFFLMDRRLLINWCAIYIPKNDKLLKNVWHEVHEQIGNYIRGKVLEIILVGVTCYITFALMKLHYAALLAALVALSVIIPYIGAVLVTIPIVIIASVQWGWSAQLAYFMVAYAIIIIIDANILVPILFAEAVKLHPVAIIVAILIFGGLLGFWGVFFAIPLASLVKAVLRAWPTRELVEKR